MLDTFTKELLSKHLISLLAADQGCYVTENTNDFGVDFSISKLVHYTINDKKRYFNSGKTVDVQLKCTTNKQLIETPKRFKFDLKVNNYNDLIFRRKETTLDKNPLILMLIVLPTKSKWLNIQNDKLEIAAKRFWFVFNKIATFSQNQQSIRIEIPKENIVNEVFFQKLFKMFIK